ncbi:GNAT family N-acetyltransferase [Oryzifoliimicrobium ureilyticus]|uniref:GNAT family N-acetyltransferase n=1 Tax=Oryzifoliimicrobium ureilyticus TaxID=3113724 RepID=UPI00307635E0
MTSDFAVRPMRPGELELALEWARQEGWNPGVDDSHGFHAADPEGFLVGALGEVPIGSISLVKYGADFAFLGLYLVHPEFRGRGFGKALWDAAIAAAGTRTIGLDGVPAQQDNYRRKGFEIAYRTQRYGGVPLQPPVATLVAQPVTEKIDGLVRYDASIFTVARPDFLTAWCETRRGRRTYIVRKSGKIKGYGTIRRCFDGYKIGPVFAADAEIARALFAALLPEAAGARIFIDVPADNGPAVELCQSLGLQPVFETARMYRGPAPAIPLRNVFGVTTLELG